MMKNLILILLIFLSYLGYGQVTSDDMIKDSVDFYIRTGGDIKAVNHNKLLTMLINSKVNKDSTHWTGTTDITNSNAGKVTVKNPYFYPLPPYATPRAIGRVLGVETNGQVKWSYPIDLFNLMQDTTAKSPTPYATWARDTTRHYVYTTNPIDSVVIGYGSGFVPAATLDINGSIWTRGLAYFASQTSFNDDVNFLHIDSASTAYGLYYDKTTGLVSYDSAGTGGDNLGNHTATEMLNMDGNDIGDADSVHANVIELSKTSATVGQIKQNNKIIFHTYGANMFQYLNLFIGDSVGNFINTGYYNYGFGEKVLKSLTSGYENIGIGYSALKDNTSGNYNIAIGGDALSANKANTCSVAIGIQALKNTNNTTSGSITSNTAIGFQAMMGSSTPSNNTGVSNTAIGYLTQHNYTSGNFNNTLGVQSGNHLTSGCENDLYGFDAGYNITTGSRNVAVGSNSLYNNIGNDKSTAIGYYAMYNAYDGSTSRTTYNTAVGYEALKGSATPANNTGQYNTAVGYQALTSITAGNGNVTLGAFSSYSTNSGVNNTTVGTSAFYFNTTGQENSAFGNSALYTNTIGDSNVAIGSSSLNRNVSGTYNTSIGGWSGYLNVTGNRNVFLGYQAGYSETGSNKLYIENSNSATPLIGGDFAIDEVTINGDLTVTGSINGGGGSESDPVWIGDSSSYYTKAHVNGLLATKAALSHTQAISTITGLGDSLANHYTKAEANGKFSSKTAINNIFWIGVDSTAQNTSDIYWLGYSQGFVIDTLIYSLQRRTGSPDLTAKVWYGLDQNAAGTAVVTAGNQITTYNAVTKISTFNSATIAKGNQVWLTFSATAVKTKGFFVNIIGHSL
jgi:hypothetical protein